MIELDTLEAAATAFLAAEVNDAEIPDVAGRVRKIERDLQTRRIALEDSAVGRDASSDPEAHTVATGTAYQLVPTVKIERTYNTPGILAAVADSTGQTLTQVILSAIEAKAMKLEWSYRAMVKWVKRNGATVTTASGAATESDLDEPMIREIEKAGRPERVPVGETAAAAADVEPGRDAPLEELQ